MTKSKKIGQGQTPLARPRQVITAAISSSASVGSLVSPEHRHSASITATPAKSSIPNVKSTSNDSSTSALSPKPLTTSESTIIPPFLLGMIPSIRVPTYLSKLHDKHINIGLPKPIVHSNKKKRKCTSNTPNKSKKQKIPKEVVKDISEETSTMEDDPEPHNLIHRPTYASFLPLHNLWTDYMVDVSQSSSSRLPLAARLLKSDWHGSLITVTRSMLPTLVGISGILLSETKTNFKLITKQDEMKTIPKQGCDFSMIVNNRTFILHGSSLCVRGDERARKKFKQPSNIMLSRR